MRFVHSVQLGLPFVVLVACVSNGHLSGPDQRDGNSPVDLATDAVSADRTVDVPVAPDGRGTLDLGVDASDAAPKDAAELDLGPCVPASCASLRIDCGLAQDGCGGVLACGTCPAGKMCDAATRACVAVESLCGGPSACGYAGDVCGNSVACGQACPLGSKCQNNTCVVCPPLTCEGRCGRVKDGCGAVADCGTCGSDQVCDAIRQVCTDCKQLTCADYPKGVCGTLSNGCGATITCPCPGTRATMCTILGAECGKVPDPCLDGQTDDCGPCDTGKTCVTNRCVDCVPISCAAAGRTCGTMDDGCGHRLDCGDCQANEICTHGVCTACTPRSCASAGRTCGTMDDGCGKTLNCGSCETNEICTHGRCALCTPKTCASEGKNCGTLSDGCGQTLHCGSCRTNEICSGNVCTTCVPKTCAALERTCGTIDDGCGHKLTCPGCGPTEVCLANGSCCQPLTCASFSGVGPDGCGGTLRCAYE